MPASLAPMLTILPRGGTLFALPLFALTLLAMASPAQAGPVATTRVVACDAGSCLLLRGRRAAPHDVVRINGRPVDASGGTSWRVRLPVATIRDWSEPFARTLEIAVTGAAGSAERSDKVRLPVGLLGNKVELASLIVNAR